MSDDMDVQQGVDERRMRKERESRAGTPVKVQQRKIMRMVVCPKTKRQMMLSSCQKCEDYVGHDGTFVDCKVISQQGRAITRS